MEDDGVCNVEKEDGSHSSTPSPWLRTCLVFNSDGQLKYMPVGLYSLMLLSENSGEIPKSCNDQQVVRHFTHEIPIVEKEKLLVQSGPWEPLARRAHGDRAERRRTLLRREDEAR